PGRPPWCAVVLLPSSHSPPPNPPAVGDPNTIDERTILYFAVLAWSIGAAFLALRLGRWMRTRQHPDPARQTAVAAVWIGLVAVGFIVLPGSPDAVTAPATLIWRFRVARAGGALGLWGVTGVVFGMLSLTAGRRTGRGEGNEPGARWRRGDVRVVSAVVAGAAGLEIGLVATAVALGFRHGFDWDHVAALSDIAASQHSRRRSMALATLYALGHATVAFAIGAAVILASARLPESVGDAMERLVGVTLIALGFSVIVSTVRHGGSTRLPSRGAVLVAGLRRLRRR